MGTVANKLPAIPQFLLRYRSQHCSRHGGDQEEDAGDEGGEGQRLRQGRRLRGAVQGRKAACVQGGGRGGGAGDEGSAARDRARPHRREARHLYTFLKSSRHILYGTEVKVEKKCILCMKIYF